MTARGVDTRPQSPARVHHAGQVRDMAKTRTSGRIARPFKSLSCQLGIGPEQWQQAPRRLTGIRRIWGLMASGKSSGPASAPLGPPFFLPGLGNVKLDRIADRWQAKLRRLLLDG